MVADEAVRRAPGFGPFEQRRWTRTRVMTPPELEAMVTSRSSYLTAPEPEQRAVLAAVRELIATHPHSAGRDRVDFPLNTTCYRATAL